MRRRMAWWAAGATLFWSAYGLVSTIQYHNMQVGAGQEADWLRALTPSLASALLWIPFTLMALWLAERWPLGHRWATGVGVHLGGLLVTVVGRGGAVLAFNPWVHWYLELPGLEELFLTSVQNNVFLYGLITGAAHAVHYARQSRLREAQVSRAELHALRAQIRPHFLFNTLNTIAELVHEDPDRADRMIVQLGTLLRCSLAGDHAVEVPLRTELATVNAYVDIERTRFADRLGVEWDVQRSTLDALVPALILQPLVENAVRHGLAPRAAPGVLRIVAHRDDGWLHLVVEDDGVGLPPDAHAPRERIGLTNTRSRLEQMYRSRYAFTVTCRVGGGVSARLSIPYRGGGG